MNRLLLAIALAGPLCGSAMAATVTVHIANFTFDPPVLTVKAGTTVIWLNDDDIPHSVIETSHIFHSAPLDTGDSFTMTFQDPGEIDYFCGFHAMMQGKIIVTP